MITIFIMMPFIAYAEEVTGSGVATVITTAETTTVSEAATATAPVAAEVVTPAEPAAPVINSGDTAWILTSSALVLLMTVPALALFYGGMVRKKNILSTFY